MTVKPVIHGRDHAAGGSDPIPGIGSGGGAKKLLACWAGQQLPPATGYGLVWRVPYDSDGSSFTFTLASAFARLEAAYASTITFTIEKSSGGGAFSPTTVATVAVTGGSYEGTATPSGSVTSGDLLRLVFTTIGSTSAYQVELLGSE